MLPKLYLDAKTWQALPGDIFFARYPGEESIQPHDLNPSSVYRPVSAVPSEIVIRTSEREKRLEFELKAKEVASGAWGKLIDVSGAGSQVGIILIPAPIFIGVHHLPDVVQLLGNSETVAYDAIIRDIHIAKTVRFFSVGSISDSNLPEELIMTTKFRWFRNRCNPKHLGFSKEEK
jgi:hypothetical protein